MPDPGVLRGRSTNPAITAHGWHNFLWAKERVVGFRLVLDAGPMGPLPESSRN